MSEWSAHDRHGLRTLALAVLTLIVVLGTICAVVLNVGSLDRITFLGFPLGFYLLAQGLLIGIVAVGFWAARLQDRVDNAFLEDDEV